MKGALVLREARAAIEAKTGRPITPAQAKKLFETYEDSLFYLGFRQQANGQWIRERSGLEKLLG